MQREKNNYIAKLATTFPISCWRHVWSTLLPYIKNRLKISRLISFSYNCVCLFTCQKIIYKHRGEKTKQSKTNLKKKIQTKKVLNGKHSLYLRISASSSITKFMQTVKVLISNEESVLCIKRRIKMNHSSSIRQLFLNCFSWIRLAGLEIVCYLGAMLLGKR